MSPVSIKLKRAPLAVCIAGDSLETYKLERKQRLRDALAATAHAQGFAEATQTAAKALDTASAELDTLRAEMADRLAESAAQLAVEMLQELLRVELVAKNYNILEIVRATIAEAGSSPGTMALHVHPEDAESLKDVSFRSGTTLQADPAIRRGDVELHTAQGLLVRDMDACAASIRERVLAEVKAC